MNGVSTKDSDQVGTKVFQTSIMPFDFLEWDHFVDSNKFWLGRRMELSYRRGSILRYPVTWLRTMSVNNNRKQK